MLDFWGGIQSPSLLLESFCFLIFFADFGELCQRAGMEVRRRNIMNYFGWFWVFRFSLPLETTLTKFSFTEQKIISLFH